MRKYVFMGFEQVKHKPVCTATEASLRLEILNIETKEINSNEYGYISAEEIRYVFDEI